MSKPPIPLKGPPDGWPRTKDGYLVKPGDTICSYDALGVIRKIYDGGEYGFCAEWEDEDGPQGWVPLIGATRAVQTDG